MTSRIASLNWWTFAIGTAVLIAAFACSSDSTTGLNGARCDVTNPVSSIRVSPGSAVLHFRSPPRSSDSVQLADTAINRVGDPRFDVPFKFTSSDTSVVVVTDSGVVEARGDGTAVVTVSTCGQSSKVSFTVMSDVARVVLTPSIDSLVAGDSLVLSALAFDASGAALSHIVFAWASSAPAVATITPTGDSTALAHTLAAGTANIEATGEGNSATSQLVVLPRVFLASSAPATAGIAAGLRISCGIISLGRGYCWGLDDHGQLGAAADSSCFEEIRVDTIPFRKCSIDPLRFGSGLAFADVSAGDSSACGVTSDGSAYCWGDNAVGELGNGNTGDGPPPHLVTGAIRFATVTVGGRHACGLTSDGTGYCWGRDSSGELGDARAVNSTTPIPVVADPANGTPIPFSVISAGAKHSCGISTGSVAYCWGSDSVGQLGTTASHSECGTGSCSTSPARVSAPSGITFASVSAGLSHSCALATTGAAYCWGANDRGELGTGSASAPAFTPVLVSGGLTFTQISSGGEYTCALTQAGAAYCWGSNRDLTLGVGPYSGGGGFIAAPTAVLGGVLFARLSAGTNHVCGISVAGAAYCWGSNEYGALGNSLQAAFRGVPQPVSTPR